MWEGQKWLVSRKFETQIKNYDCRPKKKLIIELKCKKWKFDFNKFYVSFSFSSYIFVNRN